jgi:hypothetical protein
VLRRLAHAIVGLAVLVAPALAAVPPANAAGNGWKVFAASRFSPNGDGVKDTLSIRYRLPVDAHVRLTISPASHGGRPVRQVDLGHQPAGTHTWTWNGGSQSGPILDRAYVIRLYDVDPSTKQAARVAERVQVDTTFQAALTAPTYGAEPGTPARIYPRTTVVTDTLDLRTYAEEKRLDTLELVIRNGKGRVVRRADVAEQIRTASGYLYGHGRTVTWAAVRGGEPLPKGRYTAVVVGRDKAGNAGRSQPVKIWVSDDQLEWRETTTTVTADESDFGRCTYSSANGCGDYPDCGAVVASTLYVGGLSYRSTPCEDPGSYQSRASAPHLLEVPEATGVRGLSAVRVAFVGTPTTAGEADTGTLSVWGYDVDDDALVVGTTGQSTWVDDPAWGAGRAADTDRGVPRRDPAAAWSFSTTGTDSVDVATFTVDVRYLAVMD